MTNWAARAACRDEDPDMFFPIAPELPDEDEAKAVCRSCRVRSECLAEALQRREPYGVWGGLAERERRLVGRARARWAA
ncbi:WhiB family transcriptional regulator [Nonomuraea dietziae]|uniref:WhiB family transcriptional regulator n=1 Tax=Nonomuraea dietziae TaxID=65515 RepID=UPI003408E439